MFRHNRFEQKERDSRNLTPTLNSSNSMTNMLNYTKTSPIVTPIRPVYRRYLLSDTMSPTRYNNSPRNLPRISSNSSYNTHLSTQLDSKSPGFSSRLVQYNEEREKSLPICQRKYDKLGVFPIVHFFKKDVPSIKRKLNWVNIHCNSSELANYNSPEHNRMLLEKIIKTNPGNESVTSQDDEANTKSVLDALKEISRKRIHSTEDDFVPQNSGKRMYMGYENDEVSRKRVKPQEDSSKVSCPPKRICMMDELGASRSSSEGLLDEKPQKRPKPNADASSAEKPPARAKCVDVETQTPSSPAPVAPSPEPVSTQQKEKENADASSSTPNRPVKPPRVSPIKIFDDSRLETLRRNRLSVLLGSLAPVRHQNEKTEVEKNEEKTEKPLVSILAGANKSPHKNKHVTFNIPETQVSTAVSTNSSSGAVEGGSVSNETSVTKTSASLIAPIVSASIVVTSPISKIESSTNGIATTQPLLSAFAAPGSSKPEAASPASLSFSAKPEEKKSESAPSTGFMFTATDVKTPTTTSSPQKGGFKFDLKEPVKPANTLTPSFTFKPTEETKKSASEATSSFTPNVSPFAPSVAGASKENSATFAVPTISTTTSPGTGLNSNKFSFGTSSGVNETTTHGFNFMSPTTSSVNQNKLLNAATTSASKSGSASPSFNMYSTLNFSPSTKARSFSTATPSFSTNALPPSYTKSTPAPSLASKSTPKSIFSASTAPNFSRNPALPSNFSTTSTASSFTTTMAPPPSYSTSSALAPSYPTSAPAPSYPGSAPAPSYPSSTPAPSFSANAATPSFATNVATPTFSTNISTSNVFGKVGSPGFTANMSTPSFATNTSVPSFPTKAATNGPTPGFSNVSTSSFPVTTTSSFSANTVPNFGTNVTTSAPGFSTNTTNFAAPNSTNKSSLFAFGPNNNATPNFTATSANIFDSAAKTTTTSSVSIFPTTTTSVAPSFAQPPPAFGSFSSTFNKPASNAFGTANSGLPSVFPGNVTESQPTAGTFGTPSASFGTNPPAFGTNNNNSSIFGNNNAQTKSIFGQASTPMFGTTTTTTAATNTFGNVATTTSGIFGGFGTQTTTSSSPFGATKTTSFGSSGFGSSSFGSNNPAPAFGDAPNNRPFGAPANPAFGTPNTNANSTGFSANSSGFSSFASTGSFGQSNNAFGSSGNAAGFSAPSPFDKPPASNPEPGPFGGGANTASPAFGNNFATNQPASQGEVFTFGGSASATKPAVFSFGNSEPPKPSFNFTAENNSNMFGANKSFGAGAPAFNAAAPSAPFNLQSNGPGMFNIGTGGSSAQPRSRVMHKGKRRT